MDQIADAATGVRAFQNMVPIRDGTCLNTFVFLPAGGTRFPVILYGTAYWAGLLDWIRGSVLPAGKIGAADADLLAVTDDVDEIVARIVSAAGERSGGRAAE